MAKQQITKFERGFLFVLFFELFAGGGGRFIEFGPISIRQVLFVGVMALFVIRFILNKDTRTEILGYFKKPNTAVLWLSIAMLVWIGFSAINGYLHGHGLGIIATDTLRVIYVVLILPFIYYIGEGRFSLKDLLKTLFIAALVVSLITIVIALIGKFMTDSQFYYFYKDVNKLFPGDLYFRPSRGVFHKSLFLVLFAVIIAGVKFMENDLKLFQGIVFVIGFVALVLSETRGLYLGIILAFATYLAVKLVVYFWGDRKTLHLTKKNNIRRIAFLVVMLFATLHFYSNSTVARFSQPGGDVPSGEKIKESDMIEDESLNVRVVLLADSVKILKTSPNVLIFGNGYGTKIGKRLTGIEMSFVDIMVEQGAIGVIIWLAFSLLPLFYMFKSFLLKKELNNDYIALLGCTFAMLLVTNINPFLNSPIGLGFLLPVIVLSYKFFVTSKNKAQA